MSFEEAFDSAKKNGMTVPALSTTEDQIKLGEASEKMVKKFGKSFLETASFVSNTEPNMELEKSVHESTKPATQV